MSSHRRKGVRLRPISTGAKGLVFSAVVVAATTVWFLVSTVLTGFTSDAAIVGSGGVLACLFALASGLPALPPLIRAAPRALTRAALAGVLMLLVAPAFVLANRYSDAPPGTEVLFFTTASWGLIAVVAAGVSTPGARRTAEWPSALAYACTALLGAALILANWERPSSFSPFMRYWREEIYMLVAGVAWALGSVLYERARTVLGEHDTRGIALLSGGLFAAGFWAMSTAAGSGFVSDWNTLLVGGVAYVTLLGAWSRLHLSVGGLRAPFTFFLVPVVLTLLGVVEQAVNPRGPDPVVWQGALSGIALVSLATGAAALGPPPARPEDVPAGHDVAARASERSSAAPRPSAISPRIIRVLVPFAALIAILAAVSLAAPAMDAQVLGRLSLGKPYAAKWVMLGYETAAGWIPVVAALLVLAGAWSLRVSERRRAVAVPAVLALVVLGLYPAGAPTPLHTWNTWLPSSLQVEFGTEYTALTFAVIHHPARLAIMGLTALAAAFLLLVAASSRSASTTGTTSEVSR